MLPKNSRSFSFTELQSQQLKRTNHSLRKLNHAALHELQRIGYPGLTNTQYGRAGKSLGILAIRLNSALRFREGIIVTAGEQKPELIQVSVGSICDTCSNNERTHPSDHHQADPLELLQPDAAHEAEVDDLLSFAYGTEELVSEGFMSRRNLPRTFFAGLSRLTAALLRQQRHLKDTTPEHKTKIEVQNCETTCVVCGKPEEEQADRD